MAIEDVGETLDFVLHRSKSRVDKIVLFSKVNQVSEERCWSTTTRADGILRCR